ncbi:twin-arginine translocase TatA/TatE family subunit [Desulfobotulus mexicanus]|uniref:Sec-independent protein translocase protein TatA n=1 Tax=Desulfobotulus mexicanus TaxID=2586642 RepID=A0A5S5MER0_9BACT|nr:twin-arginine translocase TatA/TatE family subunit [Desulfobotulus mexicanus]TYT74180.1 twin-arginine translocase TatA/TatE family subunit [Desulfobotulus mexicanus]
MFGMGMPEILIILALALIVIGPKKLPDLARSLGKAFGEFKSASKDFKDALNAETPVGEESKSLKAPDENKEKDTRHEG